MRVIQPIGQRGSLKWLQIAIAKRPSVLQPTALPQIEWLSPISRDEFAEYRDGSFLKLLKLQNLSSELRLFWPQRGPQWDALGQTANGPVLVEAKAHIREFFSPPTQASQRSAAQIRAAFSHVQNDLGITPNSDWSRVFFQYANRLAFLHWLRRHGVRAELVFVSFLNDHDMNGPSHAETWDAAFSSANYTLGIPPSSKLMRHVHHVMPDVTELPDQLND